jgi:hypothetical protein
MGLPPQSYAGRRPTLKRVGKLYQGLETLPSHLRLSKSARPRFVQAAPQGAAPSWPRIRMMWWLPPEPRPPWMAIEWPDFLFKMH